MQWTFQMPGEFSVEVVWVDEVDIDGRLREFSDTGERPSPPPARYAQATYLKYKAVRQDFALAAASFDEWQDHWGQGRQCFALLEARHAPSGGRVAGALLLRRAWTGDVVVDYLASNPTVTQAHGIRNTGWILLAAALDIGLQSAANLVFVETAAHSREYWDLLLEHGYRFIKVDSVTKAAERLGTKFKDLNAEFQRKTG